MAAGDRAGLADVSPALGQAAGPSQRSESLAQRDEVAEAVVHRPCLVPVRRRHLHAVPRVLRPCLCHCHRAHHTCLATPASNKHLGAITQRIRLSLCSPQCLAIPASNGCVGNHSEHESVRNRWVSVSILQDDRGCTVYPDKK